MNNVDISFIMPVHNGEMFLQKTINCVLSQKDINFEIIIIDDFSNDRSYDIAAKYNKIDNRIKLIKNKRNEGFTKTINLGLKKSTGKYLIILDQDDYLENNHCKKMIEYMNDNVSMVFCDYNLIDENDKKFDFSNHCKHRNINIRDMIYRNQIPSIGLLINIKKLKEVGGFYENDRFINYGEYYTWIKLLEVGKSVYCCDIRSNYRRHKNNMTNSFANKKIKEELIDYYNLCRYKLLEGNKLNILEKILLKTLIKIKYI